MSPAETSSNPQSSNSRSFNVPQKSANGAGLTGLTLSSEILDARVRSRLIKHAVVMYQANRRQGTHDTKTRGQVTGSTRKLWRQKGTGRARAGSRRNPIWRGGGIVFGPHPRDYSFTINRKQRRLALRSALLAKFQSGEVLVVDRLEFDQPKTRELARVLRSVGVEGSCLIGTVETSRNLLLAARNLPRVGILPLRDFNAEAVLAARTVLLTGDAFEQLAAGAIGTGNSERKR
jgi:large subunit ribosomal protein L4